MESNNAHPFIKNFITTITPTKPSATGYYRNVPYQIHELRMDDGSIQYYPYVYEKHYIQCSFPTLIGAVYFAHDVITIDINEGEK